MTTAVCKICKETIQSLLVGMDRQKLAEDMGLIMLQHMAQQHKSYMIGLSNLTRLFSGFIVMNRFTIANQDMEDEKEEMRDKLAERVMQDAPDDNEEFEDEDQNEPEELKRDREEAEEKANELNSSIIDETRKRGEPGEIKRRRKEELSPLDTP